VKKSLPYEIIAVVLAMIGAIILVSVYYPLLNPVQFKIDSHQDTPSVGYFIFATPIPLLILSASWYFNRKAQHIKREAAKTDKPTK
jgi:uncharacterized membrane protein YedE/YeeE